MKVLVYIGYHDDTSFNEAMGVKAFFSNAFTVRLVQLPRTFFLENILWYILQDVDIEDWDYIGVLPYKYLQKISSESHISPDDFNGDCISFLNRTPGHGGFYEETEFFHGKILLDIIDQVISRVIPDMHTRIMVNGPSVWCSAFVLKKNIFKQWVEFMLKVLDNIDMLNQPVKYPGNIPRETLIQMGCVDGSYPALPFASERFITMWLYHNKYSIQPVSNY